jgi:hypothetical protein
MRRAQSRSGRVEADAVVLDLEQHPTVVPAQAHGEVLGARMPE